MKALLRIILGVILTVLIYTASRGIYYLLGSIQVPNDSINGTITLVTVLVYISPAIILSIFGFYQMGKLILKDKK